MGLQRRTRDIIGDSIATRQPFRRGNVSGRTIALGTCPDTGRLPAEERARLLSDNVDSALFVVYSYRTPIAWYANAHDTWTVPDVKYSVTTTHHQSAVRVAIHFSGEVASNAGRALTYA